MVRIQNKLSGKSFVFTGKMEAGTREEAQNLVRQLGGDTPGTLTKKVSYLVIGNLGGGGKKRTKAENYGVKIITVSVVHSQGPEVGV